ncbi:hypothetical protein EB155_09735 [archaeon]|nr:hypothetical protein [archaeon]
MALISINKKSSFNNSNEIVFNNTPIFSKDGNGSTTFSNQVVMPAGSIIKQQHYNSGYGSDARTRPNQSWITVKLGGTSLSGPRKSDDNNVLKFDKIFNNSNLSITANFPVYISNGASGNGFRLQVSTNNGSTYSLVDIRSNGPANGWGASGYGGADASIFNFTWNTLDNLTIANTVRIYTGPVYFYFECYEWSSADSSFIIDYDDTYPKFGTIQIQEIMAE